MRTEEGYFYATGTSVYLSSITGSAVYDIECAYEEPYARPDTWQCNYCGTSHWVEDRELQCKKCGGPRDV